MEEATPYMYVCSEHFLPSDYKNPSSKKKKKYLVETAIPSQKLPKRKFDPSTSEKKKKIEKAKKRTDRRAARELFKENKENISPVNSLNCIPFVHAINNNENELAASSLSMSNSTPLILAVSSTEITSSSIDLPNSTPLIPAFSDTEVTSSSINFSTSTPLLHNDNETSLSIASSNSAATQTTTPEKKTVSTQTAEIVELLKCPIMENLRKKYQLTSLTGINTFEGFQSLILALQCYEERHKTNSILRELNYEMRILMTLMKLKLSLSFTALGGIFGISRQSCSRNFKQTLCLLCVILKPLIKWQTRATVRANLPICFTPYGKTRVILDCTEFPVYTSKCLHCRNQTYSHYKKRHTLKCMIGIAPSGVITFLSSIYGGKASDKFIFNDSKLLDLLEPGDSVMVDRGFSIQEECNTKYVDVIIPSFKDQGSTQLTIEQADSSACIASARVHVERSIERLKNFRILHDEIIQSLTEVIEEVLIVICALVNLSSPILANDKF